MALSTQHTENIWKNWPYSVYVSREATLNEDLTDVVDRRLRHIGVRQSNDTVLRLTWFDAQNLRNALTDALDATEDLSGVEPLAEWERELLEGGA